MYAPMLATLSGVSLMLLLYVLIPSGIGNEVTIILVTGAVVLAFLALIVEREWLYWMRKKLMSLIRRSGISSRRN
jgi:hypothetical protein